MTEMDTAIVTGGFDYSSLPPEVASEAKTIANRVRGRAQQLTASIIATGNDLSDIKGKLEHGSFVAWLDAEFGMSVRTAQRYMQAGAAFEGKSDTVSLLPPSAVYALSAPSTPVPVRQQVIERIEAGEKIDPREVSIVVREARAAEREAAKIARLKPAQRRHHRRKERDLAKEESERQERFAAEKLAANEAVELAKERLGEDFAHFVNLVRSSGYRFIDALKSA